MAAQTVHTPLLLTKGPTYDAAFNKSQKIMVYTSNDDDDYSMMLPVDMGKAGQYLHTDGSLNMYWDEMFIKIMTSVQRLAFGVANITPTGTIVYDTTTAQTYIWNGTSWTSISGSAVDETFFINNEAPIVPGNTPGRFKFQVSPIPDNTTRTITVANRDLDLNAPVFSTVGLINGGNTMTLTPGATSTFSLTFPTGAGVANQFAQLSAPGILTWGDGLAAGQFYIFNALDDTSRLTFDITAIPTLTSRSIVMPDRDINLATPTFESVAFLDTGSAFTTTVQPFAGLAASYTITLPTNTEVPVVADVYGLLQIQSGGATHWTNTPTLAGVFIQDTLTPANAISIVAPVLAADYTITLPTGYPSTVPPLATVSSVTTAAPLVSDGTGVTSFTNTVSRIITSDTWVVDNGGASIAVGEAGKLELTPVYDQTVAGDDVTQHRYINLMTNTGTSLVSDAAAIHFNAAAAAHEALDATVVDITAGGPRNTSAWVKISINGTLHFIPVFAAPV